MTYHEALAILRGVLADSGAAYRCLGCGAIWVMSGRSCECDESAEGVDATAALERVLAQIPAPEVRS